ncbi:hypothetical protein MAA_11668 [Metarhizium robertsii ARSEF 23]|uniref:Uncharacterized protein n=1 Tax=Metarhizium robertsii (strain ARSEF 23 / ATCC MYA-3075) TaxID=655844 RepID=A0A0B2XDB4_METRA|nr:uncharacterized protein MAA_11668 [Metarhizium robertsii ARSEF 23]KHO10710.1 hypothetical protein MAA_11668 [Metarhizium robertsii ARSEF 23]
MGEVSTSQRRKPVRHPQPSGSQKGSSGVNKSISITAAAIFGANGAPERRMSAEEMDDAEDTDGQLSVSDERDSGSELEPESDRKSMELSEELLGDVW